MAFIFADHVKTFELQGSEGQVKWARTMRQQKASAIQKLGPAGIAKAIRHLLKHREQELTDRAGCNSVPRWNSFCSAVAVQALSEPQASWWIDNRAMSIEDMLEKSVGPVIEDFLANPPTWTLE